MIAIDRASARCVSLLLAVCCGMPALAQEVQDGLPLAFEENRGQSGARVQFVARGIGHDTLLTQEGASIVLAGHEGSPRSVVEVRLAGGRKDAAPAGSHPLPGTTNYLIGGDPAQHVVDVPTFARVKYTAVYPGVDLVYYGTQRELEYDLIVAPKADPRVIELQFGGVQALRVTRAGGLRMRTARGEAGFRRPVAYQDIGGAKRRVAVRYAILGKDRIGFRLGRYDDRHPLVIDPILSVSSNLWQKAAGVATDAAGNVYVVGSTWTTDLPATGGYQTQLAGATDAYVLKLNSAGTAVIYATYLGARRATTNGLGIAVDASGNAYVTGTTTSPAFPLTPGAYRTTGSTFVTKLKPAGNALAYSTYVDANVAALAVDGAGNAFMTGTTAALTTTAGAFQPTKTGAAAPYVAKLNPAGSAMAYATYLGGSANDEGKGIAVDAGGNAYVVGVARSSDFPTRTPLRPSLSGLTDAFIAKLNPAGSALVYSTYLGGSVDERGFGVAVDPAGQAVVVGWTTSVNFPVTTGVFQPRIGYVGPGISNAFVTKLNSAGDGLIWSSYLGGAWCVGSGASSCFGIFGIDEGIDVATSVAIDAAGFVYVGGYATSTLFPLVDPIQDFGYGSDVQRAPFVARIRPGGDKLAFSVVAGNRTSTANVNQIAINGNGGVVAVGSTPGELFPLTAGAILGPGHGFMFKLTSGIYPTTVRSSVNPAALAEAITLAADALSPAPGGVVTFSDGAISLGSVNVTNGTATLNVTLAPGVHRITATNSADGKISPPFFQIVNGR